MSETAVAAAVAVAAQYGLGSDDPVVLRNDWHVLVHLRPLPLVARVSSGRPLQPEERVARELDVASHAARAGARVVPPSDLLDPGPHRHGGHVVAYWSYVEPRGQLDPEDAGRALREIHEALADYAGELPDLHTEDLNNMLDTLEPSDDVDLLRELGAQAPAGAWQAVHGDAHLANCMPGPLWHDFETACRGPREFDLAALLLWKEGKARQALVAYGDHDGDVLEQCVPVYAAWICASMMVALPERPDEAPELAERLGWLRRTYGYG
jgi:aminoglycoside phosphotransferase (APT) family kinase protein